MESCQRLFDLFITQSHCRISSFSSDIRMSHCICTQNKQFGRVNQLIRVRYLSRDQSAIMYCSCCIDLCSWLGSPVSPHNLTVLMLFSSHLKKNTFLIFNLSNIVSLCSRFPSSNAACEVSLEHRRYDIFERRK